MQTTIVNVLVLLAEIAALGFFAYGGFLAAREALRELARTPATGDKALPRAAAPSASSLAKPFAHE